MILNPKPTYQIWFLDGKTGTGFSLDSIEEKWALPSKRKDIPSTILNCQSNEMRFAPLCQSLLLQGKTPVSDKI